MSHAHPALEQTFESHTVRRRIHGGRTWAIYTGLRGVGAREGGEPLRRFATDDGTFSAVGPAADAYNDSLIGRLIRFDWIREGTDRTTRERPLVLTPPPQTMKPPGTSWHDHLDAERKGRQAASAAEAPARFSCSGTSSCTALPTAPLTASAPAPAAIPGRRRV